MWAGPDLGRPWAGRQPGQRLGRLIRWAVNSQSYRTLGRQPECEVAGAVISASPCVISHGRTAGVARDPGRHAPAARPGPGTVTVTETVETESVT